MQQTPLIINSDQFQDLLNVLKDIAREIAELKIQQMELAH